jgi:hypothetical protein
MEKFISRGPNSYIEVPWRCLSICTYIKKFLFLINQSNLRFQPSTQEYGKSSWFCGSKHGFSISPGDFDPFDGF